MWHTNRRKHIQELIDCGVEMTREVRRQLVIEFQCKPQDINNELSRIRNAGRPDKYRDTHQVSSENDRARRLGIGGYIDPDEWRALCAKYNHRCLCCGEAKPLVIDHVMPLSRGGDHDIGNIQPLCRSCNAEKNTAFVDYR